MSEAQQSQYVSPAIEDFGDLTELTEGQTDGDFTDMTFPANTPKKDLTFS